jgi:hypothetical protein
MQGGIMREVSFPGGKRRLDLLKNCTIWLLPDMPASQDNHLREERLVELPPCSYELTFHIIPTGPINLQICPDSPAEVTTKEKM